MTQATHTPGPWHIDDAQIIWAGETLVAAAGRIDAPVQENARLIAAAPDLLAALEGLLHQVEYMGAPENHPDMVATRAAIAKAKGLDHATN